MPELQAEAELLAQLHAQAEVLADLQAKAEVPAPPSMRIQEARAGSPGSDDACGTSESLVSSTRTKDLWHGTRSTGARSERNWLIPSQRQPVGIRTARAADIRDIQPPRGGST